MQTPSGGGDTERALIGEEGRSHQEREGEGRPPKQGPSGAQQVCAGRNTLPREFETEHMKQEEALWDLLYGPDSVLSSST